jgi:hypothetical protein
MQYPETPLPPRFLSLRHKYSPLHPVMECPQFISSVSVRDQVSHRYNTLLKVCSIIQMFCFSECNSTTTPKAAILKPFEV